jgi:hypothetical protein
MPKIPKALTRQREELAWELSAKGLTERKIVEELDKAGLGRITQQGVSAILIRVEARALAEMTSRVGGLKAKQTSALWHIFQEALSAWERSKQAAKTLTKQVEGAAAGAVPGSSPTGVAGKGERVTTQIREQDGDPRFLDQARAALADLRKIWGADAPQKVAPTTPDGEKPYDPYRVAVKDLSDAELDLIERIAERHSRLASGTGGSSAN